MAAGRSAAPWSETCSGTATTSTRSIGSGRHPSSPTPQAAWSQGDVRDPDFVASVMERARPDALIHLAALPSPLHGTPLEVFSTNVEATFVALDAAGNAGVKRVSLASSISLLGLPYGAEGLAPLFAPVDETHPNIGTDPYALSKEVDEATAAMMHRRHGFQVVALRISNTAPMDDHLDRMRQGRDRPVVPGP